MVTFSFKLFGDSESRTILLELHGEQGQIHELRTPLRITKEMWDEQRQRPINIYLKSCKRLNIRLDRMRIAIASYLDSIGWKFEKVSLKLLASRIRKNVTVRSMTYDPKSLLGNINNYISSRAHLICTSTHKRYIVFFNLLQRFEGYRRRHLMIADVNAEFVREFLSYCKEEAYNNSTAYRTVNFVKTVLNHLEKRGIRTFVYELELPRERKNSTFITLSEDELVKIKRMDLPINLQAARDWLIISCYTGQRVSDFMKFNHTMIENVAGQECISFVQQKTQRNILLPLHPAVLIIKSQNERHFPDKIPSKRYNEQIKEVVRLAGINGLVNIGKRIGFRVLRVAIPKWKAVTSHIGRRSFASNFYGKIPTSLLMEATGHSSEQMFHRYINHIDTERIRSLQLHFEEAYRDKFLNK